MPGSRFTALWDFRVLRYAKSLLTKMRFETLGELVGESLGHRPGVAIRAAKFTAGHRIPRPPCPVDVVVGLVEERFGIAHGDGFRHLFRNERGGDLSIGCVFNDLRPDLALLLGWQLGKLTRLGLVRRQLHRTLCTIVHIFDDASRFDQLVGSSATEFPALSAVRIEGVIAGEFVETLFLDHFQSDADRVESFDVGADRGLAFGEESFFFAAVSSLPFVGSARVMISWAAISAGLD